MEDPNLISRSLLEIKVIILHLVEISFSLKSGENNVSTKNPNNSTLFDIEGYLTMNDAELNSPTTFICDLTIPDANYRKSKHLAYFPGRYFSITIPLNTNNKEGLGFEACLSLHYMTTDLRKAVA